ncbi:GntR family transcriptional regulator [Leucobacter insecticola]|uniref:GntR family transcriptional regulator n=1 Tax=Leucobacter insecticola TaxID=2714934 RepID=A0A6G8FK92_9MICO|nr:GntR family transcriptional regulator [Leucobacter insecticola]QIM16699.1 GntR family transcriptional regulator [Leucobacter insecticola]
MPFRIDESSERPIYAQIADAVRSDILQGNIVAGSALPPAKEVAIGLGINVHTVLRAYQLLRDEGLIDLKRRRGAVVTHGATAIAELRSEVQSLVERAATLGVSPDSLAALVAGTAPHSATHMTRALSGTARPNEPGEGVAI